jgi:hypothetical protein
MQNNQDLILQINETLDSHINHLKAIHTVTESKDVDGILWMRDVIRSDLLRIAEEIMAVRVALQEMDA